MPHPPTKIILSTPTRDLPAFRRLARHAAKLKRHAPVEINIASLAQKSSLPVSEVASPWHAYTAFNPTLEQFVPSQKLEPFFDAVAVAANRDLLLAKAEVLREHGLGAAFWNYLPNYLPEAVFEAHPHWRGPRTDHPRRSTHPAFAPCVEQPEVLEQYREMIGSLARLVGAMGIGTVYFKTNDAGPGLCWSHWQYVGPNGPASCRGRGMGRRVRGLIEAIQRGAADHGGPPDVFFSGNFSADELDDIAAELPPRSAVRGRPGAPVSIGNRADSCYPVTGIFDPLDLLNALRPLSDGPPRPILLDLRCSYDRGMERPDVAEAMIDLLDSALDRPPAGTRDTLDHLHRACERWVGPAEAEPLLEAFVALNDALAFKAAALPKLSALYGGVSMRYLTRPLLFDPEALRPEEEQYFLPFVFNVCRHAARADYLDQHGARLAPVGGPVVRGGGADDPRLWIVETLAGRLESVAKQFDSFDAETLGGLLRRTAMGVRLYLCVLRSAAAFFAAGVLIDRRNQNRGAPAADPWRGDADLTIFNELLRDESDNTHRLIALLEAGGLEQIQRAHGPVEEDTFVLGDDLIGQLQTKSQLMREHWRDAEAVLSSPNR